MRGRSAGPLLLCLAVAACGRELPPGGTAGAPAPAFRAVTLAGDTLSLESLRGRPVLVNLWATWCAPCRRETPFLQSLHERYVSQGLQVVGVTTDTRAALDDIQAFLDEFGVTYHILHDPEARSLDLFSAIGLPATYLIGTDGVILWSHLGEVREGDRGLERALASALEDAEAGREGLQ